MYKKKEQPQNKQKNEIKQEKKTRKMALFKKEEINKKTTNQRNKIKKGDKS